MSTYLPHKILHHPRKRFLCTPVLCPSYYGIRHAPSKVKFSQAPPTTHVSTRIRVRDTGYGIRQNLLVLFIMAASSTPKTSPSPSSISSLPTVVIPRQHCRYYTTCAARLSWPSWHLCQQPLRRPIEASIMAPPSPMVPPRSNLTTRTSFPQPRTSLVPRASPVLDCIP